MNRRQVGIDRIARARMIREREDLEKGLGQMIGDQASKFMAGRRYNKLDPAEQARVDASTGTAGKQGYQDHVLAQRRGQRSIDSANQMIGQSVNNQQQMQTSSGQGGNAYQAAHAQQLAQQAQGQPKKTGGAGYNPLAMLATGGLSAVGQGVSNFMQNRGAKKQQQQAQGQLASLAQQGAPAPPAGAPPAPAPAGAPPAGAPPAPAPPAGAPAPAGAPPAGAPPAGAPAPPANVPLPSAPSANVPLPGAEEEVPKPRDPAAIETSRPFWNTDMLDSADRIYKGMDYLRFRR